MKSAGQRKNRRRFMSACSSQFGAAAAAYTASVGHRDPAMVGRVVELARPQPERSRAGCCGRCGTHGAGTRTPCGGSNRLRYHAADARGDRA